MRANKRTIAKYNNPKGKVRKKVTSGLPQVVLITGQSGIFIDKEIQRFINDFAKFQFNPETRPHYFKIESEIEIIYRKRYNNTQTRTQVWSSILKTQYPLLEKLWIEAFNSIKKKILHLNGLVFINVHACYFHLRTQEYLSLLNIETIKSIKPHIIITLIDDIYDIRYRLSQHPHDLFYEDVESHENIMATNVIFQLMRILDWRSKEIMVSRFIAKELKCRNFVFAVKHPWKTFEKLSSVKNVVTAYLSHPISEVRRLEGRGEFNRANEIKDKINQLSEKLSEKIVVFLPTTIDEFRIKRDKKPGTSRFHKVLSERWDKDKYLSAQEMLYSFSGFADSDKLWQTERDEVSEEFSYLLTVLNNLISSQVTSRDYILVEQSDIVVVFRPLFNGNASGGVHEENLYHSDLERNMESMGSPQKHNHKRFIYCPQNDIDQYKINQLNELIDYYIQEKTLTCTTEHPFVSITDNEAQLIINTEQNENSLFDLIQTILKNHNIKVSDTGGLSTHNPLKNNRDQTEKIKRGIVVEFMNRLNVVKFYKSTAQKFITNNTFDINSFINIIYKDLNI